MKHQLLLNKQPPENALQLLVEREEIFKSLKKESGDQEITILTMIQETLTEIVSEIQTDIYAIER